MRHLVQATNQLRKIVMLAIGLLFLNLPSSRAFWRLPCQASPLVVERADPLTNPGGISQHVHAIHGGSNFNLDMNYEDATKSDCTSCKVKQDLSNYWTPQLYLAWKNGSFTSVGGGGLLVYYLQRNHPTDKYPIQAFPKDFRMLVGNPYTRSYDDSLMSKGIGWNCLGGEGFKDGKTKNPWLPPTNCPNSLRAEIMFPSCWDGENVDSTNHISHMAFPEDNESGPCPPTHPKRVITIFYEIWWSTDPFKDYWKDALNTTQPFVLATGDPLGYGLHGDFLNGWDIDVLQDAVENCTSDSGVIEECSVFDLSDYSQSTGDSCVQSQAIKEQTLGTLDALPGCNPIDYGPEAVTVCNEENRPEIEDEIEISGYLVDGGSKTLTVEKSSQSESESESKSKENKPTDDKEGEETNEPDSTKSNSPTSTGSASTLKSTDSAVSPKSVSLSSSPETDSSTTSSSSSSSPTTSNLTDSISSFYERNKVLSISIVIALIVIVLVGVILCCKSRNRAVSTMASEGKRDERLMREERALRSREMASSSESETDFGSEEEEEKLSSRRYRR
ncbi:hypothetical protein JCM5350_002150 [Sporobolomyces pararoseus]